MIYIDRIFERRESGKEKKDLIILDMPEAGNYR